MRFESRQGEKGSRLFALPSDENGFFLKQSDAFGLIMTREVEIVDLPVEVQERVVSSETYVEGAVVHGDPSGNGIRRLKNCKAIIIFPFPNNPETWTVDEFQEVTPTYTALDEATLMDENYFGGNGTITSILE